jgi:hypothetical protein
MEKLWIANNAGEVVFQVSDKSHLIAVNELLGCHIPDRAVREAQYSMTGD